MKIAVIGGGPAGVCAAWRLVRGGASVELFEAEGRVGGRTRTDVVDGYRIDTGAQLFGTLYRRVLAVLAEVGRGSGWCARPGGTRSGARGARTRWCTARPPACSPPARSRSR